MENMQIPGEYFNEYYTEVNNMNPKIYDRVMPYIERTVDNLVINSNLSNEDINDLTNSVIADSKIMMNPPEHHNHETIFDTIKMLLLMELEDRDMEVWDSGEWEDDAMATIAPIGFHRDAVFFPPFFFPFFFGPGHRRRRRRRHNHRDHDRDGRDRNRF